MRILKAGDSGLGSSMAALQAEIDTRELKLATTMPTFDANGAELTPGTYPGGGATVAAQDWTYDGGNNAIYTDAAIAASLAILPGTYKGFVATNAGGNIILAVTFDRPLVVPSGKAVAILTYRPYLKMTNNPAPAISDLTGASLMLSPS